MKMKSRHADTEAFLYLVGFLILMGVAIAITIFGPSFGLPAYFDPAVIGWGGVIIIWVVGGIVGALIVGIIRKYCG
ncbi:MAG: hypothetical protein ACW976_00925 [Candidatus Ranarchaeia archaeon]|jgi:hypothetical protein